MKDSDSSGQSWLRLKEKGRYHFIDNEFEPALENYRLALQNCTIASEKQILLSNIVACRLKIGGETQAAAAVEDAKQCVALNKKWAKGHVRLASAYIALGNHSNDACNSLQTALRLDRSNQAARQMLMNELRRDAHPHPQPTAPPEDMDDAPPAQPTPNNINNPFRPRNNVHRPAPNRRQGAHDVDEAYSWQDRLKFYWQACVTWYQEQPQDVKTLLTVLLGLLILYITFGGRFGFESKQARGNYDGSSAYDRYRNRNAAGGSSGSSPYDGYGSSNSYGSSSTNQRRTNSYNDYDNTYTDRTYSTRPSRSSSYHFPNLLDGSPLSMLCLAVVGYVCHINGINPFQALFMFNMIGGNRGRGMRRMGMMGMGYGMANNMGMFGNRQRRQGRQRWY